MGDRFGENEELGMGYRRKDVVYNGRTLRRAIIRRTVDFNSPLIKYLQARKYMRDERDVPTLLPHEYYIREMCPPLALTHDPANGVCLRFVHQSKNKKPKPVNSVVWYPEGRRLLAGSSSGEFTLWNGFTFNFETLLQAHDSAIRAMVWSPTQKYLVSSDNNGTVKYWEPNMNNINAFEAHANMAVRAVSFGPADHKFCTGADDGLLKIWDFKRSEEERSLKGHGGDIRTAAWHPQKGLIISGGKDKGVKFWDPRLPECLTTKHLHKNTISKLEWNQNGNLFLSASRDKILKVFDIRKMKEFMVFKGHEGEISAATWHPIHETLLASGDSIGCFMHWQLDVAKPICAVEEAHESFIWDMAYHPMGHLLCTGSNDHTVKFWCRGRPGDTINDRYRLGTRNATLPVDDVVQDINGEPVTNTALELPPEVREERRKNLAAAIKGRRAVVIHSLPAKDEEGKEGEAGVREEEVGATFNPFHALPGRATATSAMERAEEVEIVAAVERGHHAGPESGRERDRDRRQQRRGGREGPGHGGWGDGRRGPDMGGFPRDRHFDHYGRGNFDPRFPPPPRSRGADFDGFGMGRGPPSHDFDRRPPFAGDQRFSRGPPAPLHQPPPPQPPQSFQDGRDPFGRDLPRRNAPSGHQEQQGGGSWGR